MATILSFKDLVVWQKSHQFVLGIYSVTAAFPREEVYALTSQIRRAAVSIPANIAEGFKKKTLPNKINFLSHSLNYISPLDFDRLILDAEEVSKLIGGYSKSIKSYHEKSQVK